MTPERAVAVAAEALGDAPEAFEVLGSDTAVTLGWADRIVRVGGTRSAMGLPIGDWAEALVEISPVLVAPLGPPVVVDDGAILVFDRLPVTGVDALDPVEAGAALAALHADGAAYLDHVAFPAFDPLALARGWLARTGDLIPDEAEHALIDEIEATWSDVRGPRTVLHGDAHAANWCADATGRWRLIDADYLGAGPAVYDLAPLTVVDERVGRGPERARALQRAYEAAAGPVDDASLVAAIRVRTLLSVLWFAAQPRAERSAVRGRLADLVGPPTPPPSHPDS